MQNDEVCVNRGNQAVTVYLLNPDQREKVRSYFQSVGLITRPWTLPCLSKLIIYDHCLELRTYTVMKNVHALLPKFTQSNLVNPASPKTLLSPCNLIRWFWGNVL